MDDPIAFEELKTHEDLNGKPADEFFVQSIVVVSDDELVQVVAEKFENDADMLPEYDEVFYPDHVRLLVIIQLLDVTEDFDLDEGLLGKFWVGLDHLQSHLFFVLMVIGLQDLAVGSLSDH